MATISTPPHSSVGPAVAIRFTVFPQSRCVRSFNDSALNHTMRTETTSVSLFPAMCGYFVELRESPSRSAGKLFRLRASSV